MRYLLAVMLLVTALVPAAALAQDDAICTTEDLEQDLWVLERLVSATRDTLAARNTTLTLLFFDYLQSRVSATLSVCGYDSPGSETSVGLSPSLGSGTLEDPYTFGEAGDTGAGFYLRVTGFTRPGNQLVYRENRFNDRADADTEYLIVKVAVFCAWDATRLCDVNERDIDLAGSLGRVYNTAGVAYDDELDVELIPGAAGEGDLVYLIQRAEQDLKILYRTRYGSDGLVVFEATPATGSGVRVTSIAASLNVRSGPGYAFPVVDKFLRGEQNIAIGRNRNGRWLQIPTGWVLTTLVRADGDVMSLAVVSQ